MLLAKKAVAEGDDAWQWHPVTGALRAAWAKSVEQIAPKVVAQAPETRDAKIQYWRWPAVGSWMLLKSARCGIASTPLTREALEADNKPCKQ